MPVSALPDQSQVTQDESQTPVEQDQARVQVAQDEPPPNCREFTAPVIIEGQQQQAFGLACQQPDGSWRITQEAPGMPPQVYTLPPQAIYAYPYPYPYYWAPDFYGPPFFAGGSVVFVDRFHHFHHGGFHHDGHVHHPQHGAPMHHGGPHQFNMGGGFHGGHR